jgi:hypothetical protein
MVGRLLPGMRANYCVFRVKGKDPLAELIESDPLILNMNRGSAAEQR